MWTQRGAQWRTAVPVARVFVERTLSRRTASWDHDLHWQGVAFGEGALAHDPDLGAPNPRKQSDLPQRNDPIEADQGV